MNPKVSFNSAQFRFADHFRIFGNVPLDQAEVVCVIDAPLDQTIRWSNSDLIDRIWNDHVLLVGFVPRGVMIHSEEHEATRSLDQVKEIKGWDLEKMVSLKSRFDEEYMTICILEKILIRDSLDIKLQISIGKNSPLNRLLRRVLPNSINRKNVRRELLNLSTTDGYPATVKKRVQFWINRVKRSFDLTCAEKYAEIFKLRQASLKETIESELVGNQKLEKKVIVFLERDQVLDPEMSEFLLTKKCVAISSKRLPAIFPEDQVERWSEKEIPFSEEIKRIDDSIIVSPITELQSRLNAIPPVIGPIKEFFRTTTFHDLLRLSHEEAESE